MNAGNELDSILLCGPQLLREFKVLKQLAAYDNGHNTLGQEIDMDLHLNLCYGEGPFVPTLNLKKGGKR